MICIFIFFIAAKTTEKLCFRCIYAFISDMKEILNQYVSYFYFLAKLHGVLKIKRQKLNAKINVPKSIRLHLCKAIPELLNDSKTIYMYEFKT